MANHCNNAYYEGYTAAGHWIGLQIPDGFVLIDIDDKQTGQAIANAFLWNHIETIVIKTHNGFQFLFRDTYKIKAQRAKFLTLAGVVTDYRHAGKGYTVMPTFNIPERKIFLPVNIFLATLETLITQGNVRIEDRMDNNRIYVGDKDKDLVGYVDTSLEYLYLIGGGVWNAVKKYLNSEGTHFPVSKNTLFKMLKNRGIVFSNNEKSVNTIKVKDDGEGTKCQKVLQLRLWESIRNAILNQDLILKGEYWFKEKVLKEEVIKDVAV